MFLKFILCVHAYQITIEKKLYNSTQNVSKTFWDLSIYLFFLNKA